ncbi:nitrogen permease regulator of amino acid transport activity 3-domain-containing protein [Durotheca rogersii]|uniref:nitrogen permease regulator of amino acid transport activity 3-domain-containing protein n=1 Tax=Durotheca rogersii TaxID=419775 RepID=UPI00221E6B42|nr:nitrogen permease regulator of amino acid transport activity 3-domain-containing protein [Durotheca rogersii]KAI5862682.1 nitrogen permease regulator of amino acid transport activity 3-domain-containing protein [Durotheca rogersii]
MASPILPNTSNFLGVALVVNRLRDGPLFVFHYPPRILQPCASVAPGDAPRDELDDDDDPLLSQTFRPAFAAPTPGSLPNPVDLQNWDHDDHLETDNGSQIVPWEHVAGYPTKDLESLLTPSRAFHKRLFQVSLEQLCFVSHPIYVPENGVWRKKKKKQPRYQPPKSPENPDAASKMADSTILASDVLQIETRDMAEDGAGAAAAGSGAPDVETDEKKSGMTMFNLVFILNPKKHEARELAENLYLHIIKKINKPYKYSQQKSDFVWKESKRILTLKDKGREAKTRMSTLWREILDVSSLAASIQDVYEAVSHNKIAALQLETAEGSITHSVQIPVPFYLADLPPEEESGSKGLWITTANSFIEGDNLNDPAFLDKNFALLLMSDEKKIVAELQADPDETTAAMIEFVRLSKPTTSFYQISQGTALSPAQVRRYAQHFIFWRRAIAIPPLHARDVYVLSPNSDTSRLPRASQAWARAFPLAPPLPEFLAVLSAAPRPYKLFAPSKNHRPAYLAMLAWLMRGGWVTQLCTFAYVVVWPEIRYEVDYELEADELRAAAARHRGDAEDDELRDEEDVAASSSSSGAAADDDRSASRAAASSSSPGPLSSPEVHAHSPMSLGPEAGADSAGSPAISISAAAGSATTATTTTTTTTTTPATAPSPVPSPSPSAATTTTTTTGQRAAEQARLERIATRAHRKAAEKAAHHARRPVPRATPHPSTNDAPHLAHLSPYVIVDAGRAAGRDSHYLSAIGKRLRARADGAATATATTATATTTSAGGPAAAADATTATPNTGAAAAGGPSPIPAPAPTPTTATTTTTTTAATPARPRAPPRHAALDPAAAWPVFWKYFDGRSALERVALHEDLRRRDAWALLAAMSEHLLCVRHW